jgi:hypothetical protein
VPALEAADEERHPPSGDPAWCETWWFDAWRPDGAVALTCRLTLQPAHRRAEYWCQVVRAGEPLLHIADLDVALPARGLAVRAAGLWADHVCEEAFTQWTVANEAFAVSLDDAEDALGRAYGEAAPLAVDLEWYAVGPPAPTPRGYEQPGEAHATIEVRAGRITLEGPAHRGHEWGVARYGAAPVGAVDGLHAPVLLADGAVLEQVATRDGWVRWLRAF